MKKSGLKLSTSLPKLKSFGERLRWARENAELSQEELGKATGYIQKQISNLETGVSQRPRKIKKLAEATQTSEAWLMFGIEELDNLDSQSVGVAVEFQKLDTSSKDVIVELIKKLKT